MAARKIPGSAPAPVAPPSIEDMTDADVQFEIKKAVRLTVRRLVKMIDDDNTAATAVIQAMRLACIIGGIMKPAEDELPDPAAGRGDTRKELVEAMSRQEKMSD